MKKTPRVLIADDESQIREIIAGVVVELGFSPVEAGDGAAALEILKEGQVDVVVSDIMMPKLSGIQLLEVMRSEGFETPFILATGYGSKEFSIRALKLGAFDFIEKPFDIPSLKTVIATAARVGVVLPELLKALEDSVRKKQGRDLNQDDRAEIRSLATMMALKYSKL